MATIKYEFCDGTVSEHETDDGGLLAAHEQLVNKEKRNHWKNTRRHISLQYLQEHGADITDGGGDLLDALIRQEDNAPRKRLLAALSPEQRELLEMVYIDGMTMAEIARAEGVDSSSVRHRMMRIIKKLKKFP